MALTQQFASGEDLTAAKLNASSVPVVSSTSDITSPFTGQLVFNTTDTRIYRYTGSAWRPFSSGPTWSLLRNTTQSITVASAHQLVAWNSEPVDTDNMHAAGATTVVITQAGLYSVSAKTSFTGGAVANRRASRVELNGAEVAGSLVITPAAASGSTTVTIPTLYIQCQVGDTLGVTIWAETTGVTTAAGSVGDYCLFNGTWLRD